MILYTPASCSGACEKRFYIRYGQLLSHLLADLNAGAWEAYDYSEDNSISPFNPFFADALFNWDLSQAQQRGYFLTLLTAMSPVSLVYLYGLEYENPIVRWPVPIYPSSENDLTDNYEIFREFLAHYLLPQYWDDFISVFSLEDDDSAIDEAYTSWFTKFLSLLGQTQRKYISLIKCLKDKEGKLLDQVNAQGYIKTRFNDTPQNTGEYEDPEHNTNFTRSDNSQSSDMETPIKRLKEIRDNIEDYYNAWALDFDKLFLKEEMLG